MPLEQIIIKYHTATGLDNAASAQALDRMALLNRTVGLTLRYFRPMSGQAHVLRLPQAMGPAEVEDLCARLSRLPEIAYAEPDYIFQVTRIPNDTNYSNQWHYYTPVGPDNYGVNAPAAWDITTGSATQNIAVLDTGITNHADLVGRWTGGYDFISNVTTANDGDGRDRDPRDPGDWNLAGECGTGSPAENSSWHGTHVSGTIGAASNNSQGVAGLNWNSKIIPIRVIGKCGGLLSDIADGMRWAAGLSVTGVPANPNPAKVLNMSLGSTGTCPTTYQNAIDDVYNAGGNVVVAAGNENTDAITARPANCARVIAVAATNRNGSRASYSNYGSVVKIAAPGGQTSGNSANGILSTVDSGTTVPTTDAYWYYQGTSMAAPHVSGIVSLMLSANASLTPTQVLSLLQNTATRFPSGSTCNATLCGSGIVNAGTVVAAAKNPSPCLMNAGAICLQNNRFQVQVKWRDYQNHTGIGTPVPLPASDSGLFWFFSAANWEMLIKVLNGCVINQRYWILAAATTDVEYTLTITDTVTGFKKDYFNALGTKSPAIIDADSFMGCSAQRASCAASDTGCLQEEQATRRARALVAKRLASSKLATASELLQWMQQIASEGEEADRLIRSGQESRGESSQAACSAGPYTLCLQQGRFKVEVEWRDYQGRMGRGTVVPVGSADSGLFWFFQDNNWEMLIKVLNGCSANQKFWVLAAATTDVAYTLKVTDTRTGIEKRYTNDLGTKSPAIIDTSAFGECSVPPLSCDLLEDNFNDGTTDGWTFRRATWSVVNGKLQVRNIPSGYYAVAEHDLKTPAFFRLTYQVEVENFNGSWYGFEPFSNSQEFSMGSSTVDGLGAAVTSDGRVGLVGWDPYAGQWVIFNARAYGPVQSLGVEWAADHMQLMVNGNVVQTIAGTLSSVRLDTLWIMASGTTTVMRVDDVCQNSVTATTAACGSGILPLSADHQTWLTRVEAGPEIPLSNRPVKSSDAPVVFVNLP